MRKTALFLLLAIFLLGLINIVQAEPAMTIPESIFDFGYTPQHSKVSHVFWLHSTGTDSLLIKRVRPG